jgi:two-component system, LuxR family, sensor kinase FixL
MSCHESAGRFPAHRHARGGLSTLMRAETSLAFLSAPASSVHFSLQIFALVLACATLLALGLMVLRRRRRRAGITPARAAREILDTMADALIVCDADGRIRVVNGAVQALFGYEPSELLGRSIEFLDIDESFPLRNLFNRGMFRDVETVFRTRSGEALDVSVSVSPLSDRDGEAGAVMIARDIRERRSAEKEHRDFLHRLRESNRELEEFARVASHDLQEPLRKIQAFGDRLRAEYADRLSGAGLDYLERMQSAAARMQTLINDLLVFSRVTTKADPFVPVDLKGIVDDVLSDLEVRIDQSRARVEVGSLPSIEADPLQMRQLFQNLLSNALKFRKPDVSPQVAIEGRLLSGSRRPAACQIRVADNGIGFEEKNLDRVFTMFQRLHGRSEYEGSGIGLAICRKIVERHGGDITAKSAPGKGATFIVTLPLRRQTGEAA